MSALILDTETTGLVEPRPIEIAWVRLSDPDKLQITEKFLCRYDPEKAIEYGAMTTHNIIPSDLFGSPLWSTFALPEGTEYLIGHSIDYDWQVIGSPDVKRICTKALASSLWPMLDSHRLGALIYAHLPHETARKALVGAHSAMTDVFNTGRLLRVILSNLSGMDTWKDLWVASEIARVPTVMSFGKHKGEKIADVPKTYRQWLLKQPDIDAYMREALTK